MFDFNNFRSNLNNTSNAEIMTASVAIINNLAAGPVTFQKIYHETQLGDIDLYLALHFLIASGQVKGIDPYSDIFDHSLHYSL